ncbi:DUF1294 domain-containing protein [bacterium]|nr:DUF1294 domain-containing protein [bacterium]
MDIKLIEIIIAIIVLINIISFILMILDKRRSILKNYRIKESHLFFLAICFGSVGVFLAMHIIRHKNRKWYFNFGIPLLIIQQMIIIYGMYSFLK